MPADDAAALLPTLADLPGEGWRASDPEAGLDAAPAEGELARLLAGSPTEREVVAMADSPLFVRPPARLAYGTAAVLSGEGAGWQAFRLVSSEEFAATFAGAVAGEVVAEPGGAQLLGSTSRVVEPAAAVPSGVELVARRTTFGGATAEGMVAAHVDLVVLWAGPRLLMLWLADAPGPFPDPDRDRLVAGLAGRLARWPNP